MRVNRVFVGEPIGARRTLELADAAANHVARVLRLQPGDPLVLFDGGGGEYRATVATIGRTRVAVSVAQHLPVERESPLAVSLVQGIARRERMDLVVQKATELGVARIVPVTTTRSVVRTGAGRADRRVAHWRAIVIAACEQCGRNRLPEIPPPADWHAWLAGRSPCAASFLLSPRATARLDAALPRAASVELLIGPEGGLTDDEERAALGAGFRAVRLGPRILRTETAAIAALAALQQLCGDF